MLSRVTRPSAILVIALWFSASGCAGTSTSSSAGGGSSSTTMASAVAGASSLFGSLGGASGVKDLASAFGVNLAGNSAVTRLLDPAAIDDAQTGLYNTIAKAGGQSLPEYSKDLLGALTGKRLDAAAIQGIGESLTGAAKVQGLKPDQMAALTSMWEPIATSLLGGK